MQSSNSKLTERDYEQYKDYIYIKNCFFMLLLLGAQRPKEEESSRKDPFI